MVQLHGSQKESRIDPITGLVVSKRGSQEVELIRG